MVLFKLLIYKLYIKSDGLDGFLYFFKKIILCCRFCIDRVLCYWWWGSPRLYDPCCYHLYSISSIIIYTQFILFPYFILFNFNEWCILKSFLYFLSNGKVWLDTSILFHMRSLHSVVYIILYSHSSATTVPNTFSIIHR